MPFVVKLERVAMFWDVFTETAPAEYVRPVEKVVVATPVHPPAEYASTWPGVPEKSEVVVVAIESTEAEPPSTEMAFESESGPEAVSEVVATCPRVAGVPEVEVQ